MQYREFVTDEYADSTIREILEAPVTALVGVSSLTAKALEDILKISSIFDLSANGIFHMADKITHSHMAADTPIALFGRPPSDMVDQDVMPASASRLAQMDIEILMGIGAKTGELLKDALNIKSVSELTKWPPYRAAKKLASHAFGATPDAQDPEPEELRPIARRYATDVYRFKKVFVDRTIIPTTADLTPSREITGPISFEDEQPIGLPMIGAVLTMRQEWVPHGLSLGNLAKSMTLAPGESTKLAFTEWTSRISTDSSEAASEDEALTASSDQRRALSEVQNATAQEVQSGSSTTDTSSTTKAAGISTGALGLGGLIGSSVNASIGKTTGVATTVSSSSGKRAMSADMAQKINSATRQNSALSRARRATLVQEVTQSESETLRTRVVTNYNHSHALSMHYYEVVQIYKTRVTMEDWSRVLFIPFETLDFANPAIMERFAPLLIQLLPEASDQLRGWLSVVDMSVHETQRNIIALSERALSNNLNLFSVGVESGDPLSVRFSVYGKQDALLETVTVKSGEEQPFSTLSRLGDIARIHMEMNSSLTGNSADDSVKSIDITLNLSGQNAPLDVQSRKFNLIRNAGGQTWWSIGSISLERPKIDENFLLAASNASQSLTQLVMLNMPQSTLAKLFTGREFEGQPLLEVIDLSPVAIFGNMIGFPYRPASEEPDDRWLDWKARHIDDFVPTEDLIPMPSEGLFAEAVLGRFNASEKLDITRFWDWQESPIPHQAPDISPLAAGQNQPIAPTAPSQFGAANLGYQTLPALPAPTGLGPLIGALQSDLFRDMSGLDATVSALQSAIETGADASITAATLANELEQTKMKMYGELAKLAATAATGAPVSLLGGGTDGGAGNALPGRARTSNSSAGALINHGQKLDKQRLSSSSSPLAFRGSGPVGDSRPSAFGSLAEEQAWREATGLTNASDSLLRTPDGSPVELAGAFALPLVAGGGVVITTSILMAVISEIAVLVALLAGIVVVADQIIAPALNWMIARAMELIDELVEALGRVSRIPWPKFTDLECQDLLERFSDALFKDFIAELERTHKILEGVSENPVEAESLLRERLKGQKRIIEKALKALNDFVDRGCLGKVKTSFDDLADIATVIEALEEILKYFSN